MRKVFMLMVLAVLVVLVTAPVSQAQYFKFEGLPEQQIQLEVDPILDFFTALMGGGSMYRTADLHSFGGFDIGFGTMVATIPDEFKDLPAFSEEDLVGLPYLFGSVGLVANLEAYGRFVYFPLGAGANPNLSPPRLDSRGNISLATIGLKYGVLQMIGVPKVTVMGAFSRLSVPNEYDFGDVTSLSLNAVASHSFVVLTLYGGVGVDYTKLTLDEEFLDGESFSSTETNATFGARLQILPLIFVYGNYSFSEFSSFNLGAGISLR